MSMATELKCHGVSSSQTNVSIQHNLHQHLKKLFCGYQQWLKSFYGEAEHPNSQLNTKDNNRFWRLTLSDIKTSYKATVINMVDISGRTDSNMNRTEQKVQ
jgi:hypothetical protein